MAGFNCKKRDTLTPDDKAQLDIIDQAALSTLPTLYFSFEAAETCIIEGVPGDFVECGVFAGAQCGAMALACQKHGDNRKVQLFDSFQGIPQAGPMDDPRLSGESVSSLENTQKFMQAWKIESERLVYHVGWFKDTVPVAEIDSIAILRLDGDLYESTKVCLKYLYPKLSAKGFCIIDDYALSGCRMAVSEYLGKNQLEPNIKKIEGGNGASYFRKPA